MLSRLNINVGARVIRHVTQQSLFGREISKELQKLSFGTSQVVPSKVEKIVNQVEKTIPKKAQVSNSFVLNSYRGLVQGDQVFPFPDDVLTSEQREDLKAFLEAAKKTFEEAVDPEKNDDTGTIPPDTIQALRESGSMGLMVPVEYGGMGLTNTQYARLSEVIGGRDLGVSIYVGAHQSIGYKGIVLFGTDEQKKKYLPDLATGKKIAAFALTEPGSGSDAASIKTRATLSSDGSHYTINGDKLWISNGGIADVFTVFARTSIKNEKGITKDKISAFIVERKFGGITHGPPEKKMGIKASNTCAVFFDNCKVPKENLLLNPGDGFKVAMNILNNGRFGMGASLSGTMRVAIAKAVDFASNRLQFGRKINTFEVIQEKLSQMALKHYVTESMAYTVAANMDKKSTDYQIEAAISKVFGSESAWYVVDEAIQVMGGMGFMKETGLERVMRDLRIFRIFEGTNDILRLQVSLSGCNHAGSHLSELKRALKNPVSNLALIFSAGSKRAKQTFGASTSNKAIVPLVHRNLSKEAEYASQAVEDLGKATESILLRHGKKVIEEQFIMTRLADASIDIYAMVVVLSRASRALAKDSPSAQHEELMAKAWCWEAFQRVRVNLSKTTGGENKHYKYLTEISNNLCKEGGVAHPNPVGF